MKNIEKFENLKLYLEELEKNIIFINDSKFKEDGLNKIKDIKNRIKDPKIKIGFWSFFSAGKSTIINNLIGEQILPVNQKSTTSIATTIEYGDCNKVDIIIKNKENIKNTILENTEKINESTNTVYNFKTANTLIGKNYFNYDEENFIKRCNSTNFDQRLSELNKSFNKINIKKIPKYYNLKSKKLDTDNYIKEKIKETELLIKIFTNTLNIDDVKNINEYSFKYGNEISEIIIKTTKWNFNKDIKILDLPGFGSSNDGHTKVTKEKLKDVNAFVIVEADVLTEGDCKKEMLQLKQEFPEIFKNSYFIKNKMSLIEQDSKANAEQKINAFYELSKEIGFKEENIFKIDSLEETNGEKCKYYCNFIKFKNKLVNDSEKLIIDEFINSSVQNLSIPHNYILNEINNKIKKMNLPNFSDFNYLKGILLKKEINKEIYNFKKEIEKLLNELEKNQNVEEITKRIKNDLEIEEELKNKISENIESIYHKINSKKDIHYINFQNLLPIILDIISLNETIRNKCQNSAKEIFSNKFYEKIDKNFNKKIIEYLPIKRQELLKNITKDKNINERLNGAIDIILFNYSTSIECITKKTEMVYKYLTDEDSTNLENLIENIENFKEINKNNISREVVSKIYNIDLKNNKNTEILILTNIISSEIMEYLYDEIIPNINKYILAIVNNYVKDVIIECKKIFDIDNFLEELQQNIENKKINQIQNVINEQRNELTKLNKIKLNIENAKKNI